MTTSTALWLTISTIMVILHGATMDIECGQSTVGAVKEGERISFEFVIDQKQDVVLRDTNNSFIPFLTLKDAAGRYLESVSAIDCDEDDCDEKVFSMKPLFPGTYSVEMVPDGKGGMFKVDMLCSTGSMDKTSNRLHDAMKTDVGAVTALDGIKFEKADQIKAVLASNVDIAAFEDGAVHNVLMNDNVDGIHDDLDRGVRRLYSAFQRRRVWNEDSLIDDWVNSLNDDEVDYYWKLLQSGYEDEIFRSFRAKQSFGAMAHRYGAHYDHYDHYDRYDYEGVGADGPDEATCPNRVIGLNSTQEVANGTALWSGGSCDDVLSQIITKIKDEHQNPCDSYFAGNGKVKQCGTSGYSIQPLNMKEWGKAEEQKCSFDITSSTNAPFAITVVKGHGDTAQKHPYLLKQQPDVNGAVGDYLAMKTAKWFNDIFHEIQKKISTAQTGIYKAPIIKVFDVIPEFQPGSSKWTREEAAKMKFLLPFYVPFRGDWIKFYKHSSASPTASGHTEGKMNFDECCQCNPELLLSLRGAFLMSSLLGAKDRHSGNIAIASVCTVMNIDYGHFLGRRNPWYQSGTQKRFTFPYNKLLDHYLSKIHVPDSYLTQAGVSQNLLATYGVSKTSDGWLLKEVFIATLFDDIMKLRVHFGAITSEDYAQARYDPSGNDPKWKKFSSYFVSVPAAEQWMSLTKQRQQHPLRILPYISYMLFGESSKPPKISDTFADFKKKIEKDKIGASAMAFWKGRRRAESWWRALFTRSGQMRSVPMDDKVCPPTD